MKMLIVWTILASMAAGLVGCDATAMSAPPGSATMNGAVGGGLLGAGAGALLDKKNRLAGAAIGGALGATAGGLAGQQADRNAAAAYQQGAYDAQMRGAAPPPRSY